MTGTTNQLIGYWIWETKLQKLNWNEFVNFCRNHGYELVKINLDQPLDTQGPFAVFLHKLTDIMALANRGDSKSQELMRRIESWIYQNPTMKVLDPIDNVRKLLNRYLSYSIVDKSDCVFTPTFTEITTQDPTEIKELLTKAQIKYPFICKPSGAHGTSQAHKMCIIFNDQHLSDCDPPCVAQSFINHSAILYKVYIIGKRYYLVKRPSLKNFYSYDSVETIHFDSQSISKANSQSTLSILDPEDFQINTIKPDPEKIKEIVNTIRKELGLSLLGLDIIIENHTGKYAIIDINVFPGYDGFPNLFEALLSCIDDTVNEF